MSAWFVPTRTRPVGDDWKQDLHPTDVEALGKWCYNIPNYSDYKIIQFGSNSTRQLILDLLDIDLEWYSPEQLLAMSQRFLTLTYYIKEERREELAIYAGLFKLLGDRGIGVYRDA